MAAHAALVSLTHIIDRIQQHPRPPISLGKEKESLTEKVTFLLEFLEGSSHVAGYTKEADPLESRIADAAYAAEVIIESHIADRILLGSNFDMEEGLQKVMEDMDSIRKEVRKMEKKMGVRDGNLTSAGSLRTSSTGQSAMVGFDDVVVELMEKLTGGRLNRQIIPVVGMGGIGKTTLARKVYQNQVVAEHFDILVWVTISQVYNIREVLVQLLPNRQENFSRMNNHELGIKLHKRLSNRRYLIIIDDIWDVELWDQLNLFFPDNNNGSRVMLTTRLSNLATRVTDPRGHINMAFLDEYNSWILFSKIVFREEGCPVFLEEIGKKIVENCRGLPLSIVVIGGFLAKSICTQEYWEYIAKNLNSVVNSEDSESCLKVLYTSYNELPIHLKSCFMYMGVFPEDSNIRVSLIVKLWVSEGFLKPISGKSLEEVAEEYLNDLIDRNLILVRKMGFDGKIKRCTIHDILRDLCLREGHRQKFLCNRMPLNPYLPQTIKSRCFICTRPTVEDNHPPLVLRNSKLGSPDVEGVSVWPQFRLLRIFHTVVESAIPTYLKKQDTYSSEAIFQLINLRFLSMRADSSLNSRIPSTIYRLWNLQTLIVHYAWAPIAPSEIWNMTQLRHVEFDELHLPDPPSGHRADDSVLWNLHTLMTVENFVCCEEVVRRIPNFKRLRIHYDKYEGGSHHCLNNLGRLHKIESLACFFYSKKKPCRSDLLQNLSFPYSIKKLSLGGCLLSWEDMSEKIGLLPLLQVLKLNWGPLKEASGKQLKGNSAT